jgi:hypothetical protein
MGGEAVGVPRLVYACMRARECVRMCMRVSMVHLAIAYV